MADDDEPRDPAKAGKADPDRAAILARRQRFIALALSGLATTACDKPTEGSAQPRDGKAVQGGNDDGARPQPCLDVAPPADDGAAEGSTGRPMPCLEVAPPPEPPPGQDDGAAPQACLKIAAPPPEPEPEPEPKPHPCLSIKPPEPEPEPGARPRPCLKVAPPKPRPCLRVAKPEGE